MTEEQAPALPAEVEAYVAAREAEAGVVAEPAKVEAEAKPDPAPEPPAAPEPAAESKAATLALLARKESALRKSEAAIKARDAEIRAAVETLSERMKAFEAERQAFAAVKSDPLAALEAAGYSIEDAVASAVKRQGGQLTAEQEAELAKRSGSRARTEQDKRVAELEARLESLSKAQQEREARAEAERHEATVARAQQSAAAYVAERAEQYPALAVLAEEGEDVGAILWQHHEVDGRVLTISEAAAYVEARLRPRFDRYAAKRQTATTAEPAKPAPASQQSSARHKPQTLSHEMSERATRSTMSLQEQIEEDRKAALEILMGSRKVG